MTSWQREIVGESWSLPNRAEKLISSISFNEKVNSFITSEKELIGAKQRIETNYPYFRDITPEELIRSYYKIDETELDKDLEYDEQVVFYAE